MQKALIQLDTMMRNSTVFDAINTGLIVLNQNSEVVVWNKWMRQYSFTPSEKAIGVSISSLFPDLSHRIQSVIDDALCLQLSSVISPRLIQTGLPLYFNDLWIFCCAQCTQLSCAFVFLSYPVPATGGHRMQPNRPNTPKNHPKFERSESPWFTLLKNKNIF